ncbi:MAG: hypothetical protein U1F77_01870 [Kiritimatiellia bacterium]
MKRIAILTLALAAPWLSPAADPVAYDRVFPQDTGVYLEVADFARTTTRWKASPIGKAWETDEFKPIREKLDKLMEPKGEEAREGIDNLKRISSHFTGRAAFGMADFTGFMGFIQESIKLDEERKALTGAGADAPELEEDMEDDPADPAAPAAAAAKPEEDKISADDQAKIDALDAREKELMAKGMAGLMFLAEIGGNRDALLKDLRELSEKSNAKADATSKEEIVESKDGDLTFYTVKSEPVAGSEKEEKDGAPSPDLVFTFAGEHILMGFDKASLAKSAASVVKGGAASSLSGHSDYARIRARLTDPDFVMFLDLGSVGRFLDKVLNTMEAKPNPMGFMPAQLAKALELDALAPVGVVVKMEEKGIRSVAELGFTRETKLSKVMLPLARKEADKPVFIPKDVLSVSSVRIDLPGWYASLVDLLNGISPMIGMGLNMGLMQMQQQMGVDVKTGIIDTLGDSIVYSQFLPGEDGKEEGAIPGMAPTIVAIGLKDQAALQNSLAKLSSKMGNGEEMITKSDYLGVPVYGLAETAGGGASSFSYAFLGDYIVLGIGSADALKAAIRAQKDPETSVWALPDLKKFLASAPAGAPTIEYNRVQSMIEGWSKLVNMGGLAGQPDLEDLEEDDPAAAAGAKVAGEIKDLDLKPFAKVVGNAFGFGRFEGGLMVSETFFSYADESADADNK